MSIRSNILLISLLLLAASAAGVDSKLYTLAELDAPDAVYFYNPEGGGAVFGKRVVRQKREFNPYTLENGFAETKDYTNIVVWAEKQGTKIESKVEVWVDFRGHVHSLDVLKRQIAFNALYKKAHQSPFKSRWESNEPGAHGRHLDFGGWRTGVDIAPLATTGILERTTLRIPYLKAILRYDALYQRFYQECSKLTGSNCDHEPFPNPYFDRLKKKFLAASGEIDSLDAVLLEIPVARPAKTLLNHEFYPFDGLAAPMPWRPSGLGDDIRMRHYFDATRDDRLVFASDGPPQESFIEESADPSRISNAALRSIDEARKSVDASLDDIQQIFNDIFGE